MSHQRSTEERFEAIEEVLLEIVLALRKDENEINRIRRRLKPQGTYPQPVAMVVAVQSTGAPAAKPAAHQTAKVR